MVARAARIAECAVSAGDPRFRTFCVDILSSESSRVGSPSQISRVKEALNGLIGRYC
jgi:hypothetical protein